ncbi:MAG: ABC transporter permease subunit [Dehalococcoidia bacterium]
MTRLISAELFKLRKRLMSRVLLYVMIGVLVVFYLILLAVSKAIPTGAGPHGLEDIENLLGLPTAIPFALSMLAGFGTLLAVILVASCVGNEYNWRTIRTMVISSESRFKLLGAKLISATILILIGMVIGVITGFIMSLITTAIGGYSFNFDFLTGEYVWEQFLQFWRTFFVLIPYTALAFLFAIVGRGAMTGIGLGIGVYIVESLITTFMVLAGGWVAKIPDYLIANNVNAITSLAQLPEGFRTGGFGDVSFNLPGTTHAFITLAIYSVVFLVLAFYVFRRRDVTV